MKRYLLELIVFICGAVVMILELVGSRVLAPYLGTSIVVWTSLIGIILGSLSVGYWWGGKIADREPSYHVFSLIIFIAAVLIGLSTAVKSPVLDFLQDHVESFHISAVVGTLILFAPASVVLGMISPYAVRLKIHDLDTSGTTVGTLYAISTVGSIAGTFLAGFYLIAYFGSTKILIVLSAVLVATSVFAYAGKSLALRGAVLGLLILGFLAAHSYEDFLRKQGIVEVDTQYNRVTIRAGIDERTGRPTRVMVTNPREVQSAMYTDSDDDLVLGYTRFFRLIRHFNPGVKSGLMIGGAGYSYPKDFLKAFPGASLDVVEIDPQFTALARQYFNLADDPRLRVHHQDGRTFLNRSRGYYDAIFGDAFSSLYSIPYQLTTVETVRRMYGLLNDGGVVLVNIISAIEGERGRFLRAEYRTFRAVFPQVYLLPVYSPGDGLELQNVMLVALRTAKIPPFFSSDPELNGYLSNVWTRPVAEDIPILTDDHAPVDNYILKIIRDL